MDTTGRALQLVITNVCIQCCGWKRFLASATYDNGHLNVLEEDKTSSTLVCKKPQRCAHDLGALQTLNVNIVVEIRITWHSIRVTIGMVVARRCAVKKADAMSSE